MPESRPRKFSATLSPVRIARLRSTDDRDRGWTVEDFPSRTSGSNRISSSRARNVVSAVRNPQTTPGSLTRSSAVSDGLRRHGCVGRDVALTDVFGERREDDALERVRRYCHRLECGLRRPVAGRRAARMRRSPSGSRARKCDPRLSSRVNALSAMRRVSRWGADRSRSRPAASRTRPQSSQSRWRRSRVTASGR